jgi:hypothetical protein
MRNTEELSTTALAIKGRHPSAVKAGPHHPESLGGVDRVSRLAARGSARDAAPVPRGRHLRRLESFTRLPGDVGALATAGALPIRPIRAIATWLGPIRRVALGSLA